MSGSGSDLNIFQNFEIANDLITKKDLTVGEEDDTDTGNLTLKRIISNRKRDDINVQSDTANDYYGNYIDISASALWIPRGVTNTRQQQWENNINKTVRAKPGMIMYDTTIRQFIGVIESETRTIGSTDDDGNEIKTKPIWTGLGGVVSNDQKTRIEAKNDDETDGLHFYTNDVLRIEIIQNGTLRFRSNKISLSSTVSNANIFLGDQAGFNITTGYNNTILGNQAGYSITTGYSNNILGNNAGYSITEGRYNNILGFEAGYSITTGNHNNLLGYRAGKQISSGHDNNILGHNAGYSITTGDYNNIIGYYAGYFITNGNNNNILGYQAGKSITQGNNNNILGQYAGFSITAGYGNNLLGYTAGYNITEGNYNNILGWQAGWDISGGDYNNILGYQAGYSITDGQYNNILGRSAGYKITTGHNNNLLAQYAGYSITTGSYNNILGYYAGYSITEGSHNNIIGYEAGRRITDGNYNNILGHKAGYSITGGDHNNIMGYQAGFYITTGNYNNILGYNAGQNITTGHNNNILGSHAGFSITTGNNNNILGQNAGREITTGYYNNLIGWGAGRSITQGNNNNIIGYQAGYVITTGYNNNLLGRSAGDNITEGHNNNIIGYHAGQNITTGHNNIAIGYNAGPVSGDLDYTICIGSNVTVSKSNHCRIGDASAIVGIATEPNDSFKLNVGGNINFTGTLYKNGSEYSSGAFTVSGTDAYYTDGNVGIGTDTPRTLLEVKKIDGPAAITIVSNSTENDWDAVDVRKSIIYFGNSTEVGSYQGNKAGIFCSHDRDTSSTFATQKFDFCIQNTNDWITEVTLSDSKMTILSDGNVGIGITTPAEKLHVSGNTVVTGDITAYYSDERLKIFKGKITEPLTKIKQLNGYYFIENELAKSLGYNNDKLQVGVSAQEVEKVLPEIVTKAPIDNEYKTIWYQKLTPLLIEGIKEQQTQIEQQQTQIESLQEQINELKALITK